MQVGTQKKLKNKKTCKNDHAIVPFYNNINMSQYKQIQQQFG